MLTLPHRLQTVALCSAALAALVALATASQPLPPRAVPFPQGSVTIEWSKLPDSIYALETFELSFDIVLAGTADEVGLLQLFPQALDLPLQVEAFDRIERIGLAPRDPAAPADSPRAGDAAQAAATVVVDGDVARATGPFRLEGDAPGVQRFRVTRRARVYRPGTLELPAPTARYATATSFREDLVQGRVPVDRTEWTARGEAHTIDILSLPNRDRPIRFDGAVGKFRLSSTVEPRAARIGETVVLRLLVEGATPLHDVPAPHVDAGDDVDVLGTSRLDIDGGTEFQFDLVFRSTACVETPRVDFVAFDPDLQPPGFVHLKTPSLPISIRPAAGPPDAQPAPPAGATAVTPNEPPTGTASEGDASSSPKLLWTPLVLGGILLLAILSRLRRRQAPETNSP